MNSSPRCDSGMRFKAESTAAASSVASGKRKTASSIGRSGDQEAIEKICWKSHKTGPVVVRFWSLGTTTMPIRDVIRENCEWTAENVPNAPAVIIIREKLTRRPKTVVRPCDGIFHRLSGMLHMFVPSDVLHRCAALHTAFSRVPFNQRSNHEALPSIAFHHLCQCNAHWRLCKSCHDAFVGFDATACRRVTVTWRPCAACTRR